MEEIGELGKENQITTKFKLRPAQNLKEAE